MGKTERALDFLRGQPWAAPLLAAIERAGGVRKAPAGLLFELRFAYEATLACPSAAMSTSTMRAWARRQSTFFCPTEKSSGDRIGGT